MCISPCYLPEIGAVACRYCWQCRKNRVNDLVGRCIAEQQTASATYAVTFTYAGDTTSAATLVYADFQRFMKRLRRAGYTVRYIAAGEYGSKKGRAHWHAILFFYGKAPRLVYDQAELRGDDVTLDTRFNWPHWPDGWVFFQQPDYGGLAYVLKYALKDSEAALALSHLSMSKKPPLGHSYFMELAQRYVDQGLAPQDYFYSFDDQFDAKRKRRRFFMQGKTRENFIAAYLSSWEAVKGREHPLSEIIDEYLDAQTDPWGEMSDEDIIKRMEYQPVRYANPEGDSATTGRMVRIIATYERIPITIEAHADGQIFISSEGTKQWRASGVAIQEIRERARVSYIGEWSSDGWQPLPARRDVMRRYL